MLDGIVGRSALVLALVGALVGCAGPAQDTTTAEPAPATETPAAPAASDKKPAPDDGKRIDVTKTGESVATFAGAKYIVSDATVDQAQSESYGLQEICVVHAPEEWAKAESIDWDRNSIAYSDIPMQWGKISYRYEYINESGATHEGGMLTRTNAKDFFAGADNLEQAKIGDHEVSYFVDNGSSNEIAPGIHDLEAMTSGDVPAGRVVTVYAYEQRDEECSFVVTVTCMLDEGAEAELGGEALLSDAYAPLEFAEKNSQVDASSYEADLTVESSSGAHKVVVRHKDAQLLAYNRTAVTLGLPTNDGGLAITTVDFAPEGGLEGLPASTESTESYDPAFGYADIEVSDVEEHVVDGRTFNARTVSASLDMGEQGVTTVQELRAWCDVDGDALYVKTNMEEGEDVEAALGRILSGRVEFPA